jgi:hypothetical protein
VMPSIEKAIGIPINAINVPKPLLNAVD